MKQRKFDKTATREVLNVIKAHIVEYKQDVSTTDYIKDLEKKVKEIKTDLQRVNSAIEGLSTYKAVNDPVPSILLKERIRLEKVLETTRQSIKSEIESIHFSKEMVRHLEHALTTLRKEFNQ